ncbi:hypothetical protein LZD49_32985 [Dyadobacter sp. CY261]|uniref:hypothetical protein n=1 Tax=Dyadobacter sp. CY261 TaxID=2907203 RepID=UPI001F3B5DC0|nr:hypothetical protein [Dyadobacter sp. CY261]MCF0075340.1 hypothetical protein [Dyadobacter sp. CY261]
MSLFQTEKDTIVFLGLMAYAFRKYDAPKDAAENDGSITHTKGLNIFATIADFLNMWCRIMPRYLFR